MSNTEEEKEKTQKQLNHEYIEGLRETVLKAPMSMEQAQLYVLMEISETLSGLWDLANSIDDQLRAR